MGAGIMRPIFQDRITLTRDMARNYGIKTTLFVLGLNALALVAIVVVLTPLVKWAIRG
jgi:hypothetical protein